MKKNLLLLMLVVSAATIISCHSSKKITGKASEVSTLMIRSDLKRMLGPAYLIDSLIFRLHLTNTAEVSWRNEKAKLKTKVDVDENGIAQVFQNQTKESTVMGLPAGTEGEPISVIRSKDKEITAIRVRYIIKETGNPIHIWYYATVDENDPYTIWFQSADQKTHVVSGIPLNRVTLDNRLMWKFNREFESNKTKTDWKVISPFANSKTIDSVGTKKSPEKQKKFQEEVEEN